MAMTRRAVDSYETRTHRVGGELADMLEHARFAGCTDEEYEQLLNAGRILTDAMRTVRRALTDRLS